MLRVRPGHGHDGCSRARPHCESHGGSRSQQRQPALCRVRPEKPGHGPAHAARRPHDHCARGRGQPAPLADGHQGHGRVHQRGLPAADAHGPAGAIEEELPNKHAALYSARAGGVLAVVLGGVDGHGGQCSALLVRSALPEVRRVGDLLDELLEGSSDADARLGARFHEEGGQGAGEGAALVRGHLALAVEVDFVAHEHEHELVEVGVGLQLGQPVAAQGIEGVAPGDVVDDDDALRAAVVRAAEAAEALLPGRVPDGELDAVAPGDLLHKLDFEVDAYWVGGLSGAGLVRARYQWWRAGGARPGRRPP